jgi:hypothetical protein
MANEIDTPSVLPDEYAAAIGRIAETWAQFEHQIDLGIWQLSDTHQQLAACITAQLASYYPKMKALIALAEIRGASADSVKKLNSFLGSLVPLADKRNRSVHDPRAIRPLARLGDSKSLLNRCILDL